MNKQIEREQGDTGPPVDDTLKSDDSADDLTGATVAFSLWQSDGTVVVDEDTSNVTVEDAAAGDVEYAFSGTDLDSAGLHFYEWTVTFSDGTELTYPNTEADGVPLYVNPASPS